MKFSPTTIPQAWVIELEPITDNRGFFARFFCRQAFLDHGIVFDIAQSNISYNTNRGILRGMHYQSEPHAEAKIVRCTRGEIYDVILDLRQGSPAYGKWFSIKLNANDLKSIYIPQGVAHGFLTLTENCELLYLMSESYNPELSCGVRWDDPAFAIEWPITNPILSAKDASYQLFKS